MPELDPDQTSPEYEAPAIVRLGSVAELTASTVDEGSLLRPD